MALAGDRAGRHPGRGRGRPRRPGPALRARRPLRRGLGLHQVDPGLRPRRRPLLAGPHAGGGGGRPLHRPPAGDPGRRRTSAWPTPWRWWWPTPRPGRWSSWACPRPSSTWPRPWSTWPPPPSRTGSCRPWAAAMDDVKHRPAGEVPAHLRSAAYFGARKLGHGVGYDYPHDDPRGGCPRPTAPPRSQGRVYYQPSAHGFEEEIAERMRHTEPGDDAVRRGRVSVETAALIFVDRHASSGPSACVARARLRQPHPGHHPQRGRRRPPGGHARAGRHPRGRAQGVERPRPGRRPARRTGESIAGTVDAASRLAYTTFGSPVVKAMATGAGVAKAWRQFKRKQ